MVSFVSNNLFSQSHFSLADLRLTNVRPSRSQQSPDCVVFPCHLHWNPSLLNLRLFQLCVQQKKILFGMGYWHYYACVNSKANRKLLHLTVYWLIEMLIYAAISDGIRQGYRASQWVSMIDRPEILVVSCGEIWN